MDYDISEAEEAMQDFLVDNAGYEDADGNIHINKMNRSKHLPIHNKRRV